MTWLNSELGHFRRPQPQPHGPPPKN